MHLPQGDSGILVVKIAKPKKECCAIKPRVDGAKVPAIHLCNPGSRYTLCRLGQHRGGTVCANNRRIGTTISHIGGDKTGTAGEIQEFDWPIGQGIQQLIEINVIKPQIEVFCGVARGTAIERIDCFIVVRNEWRL